MAMDKTSHPKGSIVLKLLVVVFLGLMLLSVLFPRSEWQAQSKEQDECRLRMENLSYAIREFGRAYQGYTETLNDYLQFIREDSVLVDPARYEIESLVRDPESGKDSLLLDFTDEFHLSNFTADTLRRATMIGDSIVTDSVHVRAVPHPGFEKVPVATLILTSASPISMQPRGKNVTDHALLIYSNNRLYYDWIYPEPVLLKVSDAIISQPVDTLAICPTCRKPYKLNVNVRSTLEGLVKFTVNKAPVDTNITMDTLMVDMFNHRLKTEALAEVLILVKDDSTLIEKKDSLLVANFIKRVESVKTKDAFDVSGDHTITVPADSMVNWDNPSRIRQAVFVAHVDSLSRVVKNLDVFTALTSRVSFTQSYHVAKVDTIGVSIRCPIDSVYVQPNRSLIQKIFGVGPAKNHGKVENGDLSWSEKK